MGFVWNKVDGGTVYEVMARWLDSYDTSQAADEARQHDKLTSWIHNAFP